ncbi:MAG: pilus assembly protein PilM [Solirubrobacterales bacterium]
MSSTKKSKALVGLDIEAGSIAAAEVGVNGHTAVGKFGIVPLGAGVFREGEVTDPGALADALKQLFARGKLAKTVRVGLASQRVAVRTLRLPQIDDGGELETAVRFQAQDHVPMPLDNAVLDWQVVGHSTGENGERQIDVVVVAARRDLLGGLMDAVNRAGLRPVGIDLSAFAMVRALAGESYEPVDPGDYVDAPAHVDDAGEAGMGGQAQSEGATGEVAAADNAPARLFCNLGDLTNLAVARGDRCLFTRISPFGVEGIAQKLAERRELTLEHAREWLVHVGLDRPLGEIDGDAETIAAARESLAEGATRLVDELRLSLEYYATQEGAVPVESVVACGPGTTIPGLTQRLQRDLGQRFGIGRPQALAHLDGPTAARLTMSFGLALEE